MASAQEHHFSVTRSARYYQLGELSSYTRQVWFVAHGYGQLAAYFIRHFAPLVQADPTLMVVAPEGLSRFYLSGTGGRIGATWMTREDRLAEIEDYVEYLNQLSTSILSQCAEQTKVLVLGFSQGAATVSRWLAHAPFRPAQLVLWAGAFPEDVDFAVASRLLQHLPITLVCGDQDEFISEDAFAKQHFFLQKRGVEPAVVRFNGKHTLQADVLKQLKSTFDRL
ncbi:alpha/beta hydrolase [Hymenobacter jejuensis]|uniref:Phospholipase n=1 Tax=Hymenobacter jejuensis TaxID=2502781 RepID=A0A5B8A495_9BACT|nr:phospholipase [Hymenobacter jejuensis]QDA62234.1 phospholipase [Hymenobacter jejuensis]